MNAFSIISRRIAAEECGRYAECLLSVDLFRRHRMDTSSTGSQETLHKLTTTNTHAAHNKTEE